MDTGLPHHRVDHARVTMPEDEDPVSTTVEIAGAIRSEDAAPRRTHLKRRSCELGQRSSSSAEVPAIETEYLTAVD
jgi:hypothetical protein